MKRKLGWKWLDEHGGKIVSHFDQSAWPTDGKTWRKVKRPTKECVGLNDSPRIIDARRFVYGTILARTEHAGVCIVGDGKTTSQRMRLLHAWRETPIANIAREDSLHEARPAYFAALRSASQLSGVRRDARIDAARKTLLAARERAWRRAIKHMKKMF